MAAVVTAELASRGNTVEIWTLDEGPLEKVPVSERVKVRTIGRRSKNPLDWWRCSFRIRTLSRKMDCVLVSGVWGPVDGLALRLANIPSSKLFIRTCGMLEDYILQKGATKKRIARTLYVDRNLRRANRLLVNTEIEKRNVERLGFCTRIEVIPNGVRLPSSGMSKNEAAGILNLDAAKERRRILYLGRIHPKKGLHFFLPAFAEARNRGLDWDVLVAGSFSDEAFEREIREAVARFGIGAHCTFVGEVAAQRKEACFAIADVFVLPSQSEGFPNAVVEAMSWGLPALVTPGCNFPEVAAANAGVESCLEPEELADKLAGFLADPNRLSAMGKNARSLARERYSLDRVVDRYERLATLCSPDSGIGILFANFGPYHIARINGLAAAAEEEGWPVTAFRFTERSDTYGWKPESPENIETVTLAETHPRSPLACLRLALRFWSELRQRKICAVFLPSYSPLPNFACLLATRLAGARAIMMNESWHGTEKAGPAGRIAKHLIFRLFHGALVGGQPQVRYATGYGIPSPRVATGYDVVDGAHFASAAAKWRTAGPSSLPVKGLPKRYFLNLGRFVPKKNIPSLVAAYAAVATKRPDMKIALVLVGEGPDEPALRNQIAKTGLPLIRGGDPVPDAPCAVLYPFQQIDLTPLFFARAEAFILPSLHEEWGLVVNEAMACGAPTLVSKNAGCASDLVAEGVTGFTFDPKDTNQLGALLEKFIDDPSLNSKMGNAAAERIRDWSPERFGTSAIAVLKSLQNA